MCGIAGYVGKKQAAAILIDSLKRLEYRGYDSAGIAIAGDNGKITRKRCKGKISNLEKLIRGKNLKGTTAVGHTRWATHGCPSDENAHPHADCSGRTVIVHNGIIENHASLRSALSAAGHKFNSETDTEVIAHLLEDVLKSEKDFLKAVTSAASKLEGSYALGIINSDNPGELIAVRKDSPLVIGLSADGNFIASDVPAVLPYTKEVIYLEDGQSARIKKDSVEVFDSSLKKIKKKISKITWDPVTAEKQGYRHFMLKEIHEQQRAVQETLLGRINRGDSSVSFEDFNLTAKDFKKYKKIFMTACGTAYHACLVGKFLLEDGLKIPCEVDIASEFRYRNPPIDDTTLVITVSQSGETADTLAAMREAASKGAYTLTICNVLGSTMTREADGVIYTHAGPEIGVASTKAFTCQLAALYLLTVYFGRLRGSMPVKQAREMTEGLLKLPLKIKKFLDEQEQATEKISHNYFKKNDFLYIGRHVNYPLALEGALKLKETSYIHAEGYPSGEMKHGPIALVDEEMPIVAIVNKSFVYEKMLSNIQEIKARGGKIIAIATEGDTETAKIADDVIYIPEVPEILSPILTSIPVQLLAYYISLLRGCDIDQPRNLAKSVTVE